MTYSSPLNNKHIKRELDFIDQLINETSDEEEENPYNKDQSSKKVPPKKVNDLR